ncbi:DUF1629 domain-containing protein [Frigidibacter sp. SD6-1]|uniref:imm11 family protein n=1 Tax=Frigidibacter sp. SD6-1 TaxID=3032581 RepID=UPI0024DFEB2F|nr:DUF1629 domain-containing protein [Frigidibacter sp. SD6-1]
MAWAVMRPSGMGDYHPYGELVGWDEALKHYYKNEMPEADKIAMGIEKHFSSLDFVLKFSRDLGPIAPQELPREFRTDKTERNLASWLLLGILAIDEAMKEIIERVEPGVHLFWPIKVSMPKDQVYPKNYYGLVIRRHLPAFLPEASTPEAWRSFQPTPGNILYSVIRESKAGYAGIALSKAVIGGAHLWRESRFSGRGIFMSDLLQAEIAKAGLRMPKHYKAKEV